jgi:hypothetical protein
MYSAKRKRETETRTLSCCSVFLLHSLHEPIVLLLWWGNFIPVHMFPQRLEHRADVIDEIRHGKHDDRCLFLVNGADDADSFIRFEQKFYQGNVCTLNAQVNLNEVHTRCAAPKRQIVPRVVPCQEQRTYYNSSDRKIPTTRSRKGSNQGYAERKKQCGNDGRFFKTFRKEPITLP